MDASELNEYIEGLIEEGSVTVKPEFFKAADGKDYRICVQLAKILGIPSLPSSTLIFINSS